jgi:Family of unknown function (DUF6177)
VTGAAGVADHHGGVVSHPAVDVLTDRVAVVLQERPVVPLTAWLADAVRTCADAGRGLQVVTPPSARLTTPLRFALDGPDTRWVIHDRGGGTCFDGLSGRRLHWDGAAFVPTPADGTGGRALAPEFVEPGPAVGWQLVLDVRVRHTATATARLGGALEALGTALTGQPPQGWGTAEPATEPWDAERLTALARRRAPDPTLLVVVGGSERRAVGTLRVARAASGVDEIVTLVVGYPDQVRLDALPEAAEGVSERATLVSMLAQLCPGRVDTTWEPRLRGLPVPVGMAVGPEEVERLGLDHAMAAPVPAVRPLGKGRHPAVWFQLGDATTPAGWEHLTAVLRHFGPE